jgi:hypothetical protein
VKWVSAERAQVTIVLGRQATPVERTAARLIVEEVRKRSGVALAVADEETLASTDGGLVVLGTPASNRLLAERGPRPPDDPGGESIAVRSGEIDGRPVAFAVGSGSRGALYAAAELLDRLVYTEDGVELPALDIAHRPSYALRAWEQHAPPLYAASAEANRALYLENLKLVARLRGNACFLGQSWPETSSGLMSYRHLPELFDPATEPELEARRERARQIVETASEYGLDVFLTLVELRYPPALPKLHPEIVATDPPGGTRSYLHPDGNWNLLADERPAKICTSHPLVWTWYRAKVRELIEEIPGAAGIELWISWGDTDIFYCACERCAPRPLADRMLELVEQTLAGLDEGAPGAGKRIVLRTYLGGWRHILAEEIFGPLAGRLDPRVIVANKSQWGDMYLGNAYHPLAGQFTPANQEAIEFCLGGEYRGGLRWGMLAPISEYVRDRMQHYGALGVDGMAQRHIDWHNDFTVPEFETFYALAWDRTASPELIWQRWATRTFGPEAGPRVVEIVRDGTRAMLGSMYVQGVSITSHHLFPECLERMRHLVVDRSAKLVDNGLAKIAPTAENVERIVAEKDEAIALCAAILERIERLRPLLPERSSEALRLSFGLMYELALVYRELAELFWRYLRWSATLSEVDREFQRMDLLPIVARFRQAIGRLRERVPSLWCPALFEALGTPAASWRAIDFASEFPYSYLDQIADDVERELDVVPGSLWAYFPRKC